MYEIIDREQNEEVQAQAARYGAMMQGQSDAAPNTN
jgi:hypothetical protein